MKNRTSSSLGPVVAGTSVASVASVADGGYGNIGCPASDTSFYCQLSRTTKIIQMLLVIAIIFGGISYLLYYLYKMKK